MELSVIEQTKQAFNAKNRIAAMIGVAIGGFVPVATYAVAHYEHPVMATASPTVADLVSVYSLLVLGGLVYSAKTVFDWARRAVGSPYKALGFVLLIEGVMVVSTIQPLSLAALVYLVAINGVATGSNLAVDSKVSRATRKPRAKKAEPKKPALRRVA